MWKYMFNPPEHINFYRFSNILIAAESPNFAPLCKQPVLQSAS